MHNRDLHMKKPLQLLLYTVDAKDVHICLYVCVWGGVIFIRSLSLERDNQYCGALPGIVKRALKMLREGWGFAIPPR